MYVSDRRLYLSADRERVVEEGDPDAAFLLVGEGSELSMDEARRYGLVLEEAESKANKQPKNKAVKASSEDKGQTREG